MSIAAGQMWYHKRRQTRYVVVGLAKMQVSPEWFARRGVIGSECMTQKMESASLVVYRSLSDDTLWVRPEIEFLDGRFVQETSGPHRVPQHLRDCDLVKSAGLAQEVLRECKNASDDKLYGDRS